jgi:hypothetical protein
MIRAYPKGNELNRLNEMILLIEEALPFNIWVECMCRFTEYVAIGYDSESALECTYDDNINTGDIEGVSEFTENEVEMIKTHIHFLCARDANPALFIS